MTAILSVTNAGNLGAMMTPELTAILETQATAKEETKRGYAVVLFGLTAIYGEAVSNFPVPGSRAKTHGSNQLNDFHTDKVTGKEVSWYSEFFDASPAGKALAAEIDAWNALKDGTDTIEWQPESKRLSQKRTNEINVIKNAVKLNRQMVRVKTETTADVDIIQNGDGSVVRSHQNIFFYNPEDRKQFKIMTTGQFLALSIDKAQEKNDATYKGLLNTVGDGTNNATKNKINVNTSEQFHDGMLAYGNYFRMINTDDKARASLMRKLNEAGSDELIAVLDMVEVELDKLLGMPGIAKRREEIHQRGGLEAIRRAKVAAA